MRYLWASILSTCLMPAYANFMQHCEGKTLHNFHAAGQVSVHQCHLLGQSQLNGQIHLTNSHVEQLNSAGDNTWETCHIDQANIKGNLVAQSTQVSKTLTIYSNHLSLSDSQTHDIIIHATGGATLTLAHTQVDGDITFIGTAGIVQAKNSQISGLIHNGHLQGE